jgi:hypothetical protein
LSLRVFAGSVERERNVLQHISLVRAERWRMLEAAARYYADDS